MFFARILCASTHTPNTQLACCSLCFCFLTAAVAPAYLCFVRFPAEYYRHQRGRINITLDTDLLKGPLGYTFLRAVLKKDPLNVNFDLCKTQFSILAVTTPRPHSVEYRAYMQNGSLVQAQEMVDEHHSKRAAKVTDLCITGQVGSDTACVEAVCNLYALYSFVIPKFKDSLLWKALAKFLHNITTNNAKLFFRLHAHMKQVYLHLFIAAHNILRLYHIAAIQPSNKQAVINGEPVDKEFFTNADAQAEIALMKLFADFQNQIPEHTNTIPPIAALYPYLQLGTKPTPKLTLPPSQQPIPKRVKTAPHQDVSTQKNYEANEQQKSVGFLTYVKGGPLPNLKIVYADSNGISNRVCLNGITRGKFCRWGDKCSYHHPKKLTDIPEPERRLLVKGVETTEGFGFVAGAGPAGTK